MTDRILERFMHRQNPQGANENDDPDQTEIEDLGVFGFLRGSKERSPTLQLKRRDGNILAVGYGWFEAEFDPSIGITLRFSDKKVVIKGRNLNTESRPNIRLFDGIARYRIPWVREMGYPEQLKSKETETVVESIEW
jgi:hypothetical protein